MIEQLEQLPIAEVVKLDDYLNGQQRRLVEEGKFYAATGIIDGYRQSYRIALWLAGMEIVDQEAILINLIQMRINSLKGKTNA